MNKTIKTLAAATLLTTGMSAIAATQGTAGATSTGTAVVSVTIADIVQISDMNDFAFGTYSGTGDLNGTDDVCIYRNGTGNYTVTATGSGAANAFTMTDGTNTIAYSVTLDGAALTSGTAANQTGAHASSANCAGTPNKTLNVDVLAADLQAAPAGAYTGTLTLLVAPN